MRQLMTLIKRVMAFLIVLIGAASFTLLCFLVLPLMQQITKPPANDAKLVAATAVTPPPPPPPPEPEKPEEPDEPEPEPELNEDVPPLDLSQLELALNPGMGGDGLLPDVSNKLIAASAGGDMDALFNLADLDQQPRVIYQPGPTLTAQIRKHAPGTVHVLFIVDGNGRVQDAKIQRSTSPVFEAPAIKAVSKWKFEPGKRNGEAVRFRMRVPITFPASQ